MKKIILTLAVWLPLALTLAAAEPSVAERIAQSQIFPRPILATGPGEDAEGRQLLAVLESAPSTNRLADLETFVTDHPQSAWTPSLQARLAEAYRQQGRYTLALDHWEKAWTATKGCTDGPGKEVGDAVLAHWSQLLASLGRTERLSKLFNETQGRVIPDLGLNQLFRQSHEGFGLMQAYPGTSYRCGTFALASVGLALQPKNRKIGWITDLPSPSNGFPLTRLVDLSTQVGLNLVAARRTDDTIIVPSLIHWRQNHYAAIVKQEGEMYKVVDATFGREQWLRKSVLNEEASGVFMVPTDKLPASWTKMAKVETDCIFGQGQHNDENDWEDYGCEPDIEGPGSDPDSDLDDGNECASCEDMGMARWWVTEPYLNLWCSDTPLRYRPARGRPFTFQMSYAQRYHDPSEGLLWSGHGTWIVERAGTTNASVWNHNWNSHLVLHDPTWTMGPKVFHTWDGYLYSPGGGITPISSGNAVNPRNQDQLLVLSSTGYPLDGVYDFSILGRVTNGFKLVHPDGSQDIYDQVNGSGPSDAVLTALLTKRIDPEGRTYAIWYETAVVSGTNGGTRIKYVIDPDGRTNSFGYTNTSNVRQLTDVTDAYGRKTYITYDGYLKVTSITDPVGITSTFQYPTNSSGQLTRLITPYGTNTFQYFEADPYQIVEGVSTNQGTMGGHNRINRSVLATDPAGGNHLYMYRYETDLSDGNGPVITNFYGSGVPTGMDSVDNGTDTSTNGPASLRYRNSYHWGPRQYAALSTTVQDGFTAADYRKSRLKHWLAASFTAGIALQSDRLSLKRAPSLDTAGTTEGQKTWYDYGGKDDGAAYRLGSTTDADQRVSSIARVLPDGTTQKYDIIYGSNPFPTASVSTYTQPDGTLGSRNYLYTYAANGIDLTRVYLPHETTPGSTTLVGQFGYNTTHQVVGFTNALSEPNVFKYDAETRLTNIQTSAGLTIKLSYTGTNLSAGQNAGRLSTLEEVQTGRLLTFTWTNGLVRTLADERGLKLTNTWDGLNRLVSTVFQDGTYVSNVYDKLDLVATRDRMGNWTTVGYDAMQRPIGVTNALSQATRYGWCVCGSLESITNALNQVTLLYHDHQGKLTSALLPGGELASFQYEPTGRMTNMVDGAGRQFRYTYNHQGKVVAVASSFGELSRVVYDVWDRPIQETDATGITTTNTFDKLYRVLTRTWPGNAKESLAWTTNGLSGYTNQLSQVTRFLNDAAGRLIAVTNANLEITRFAYDSLGSVTNLIDGNGKTNRWAYDVFGLMTNKVDALGNTVLGLAYNANGWATNRWTPAKGNTAFTYDALGNLTFINYPNSADIALAYDALNRLTNVVDGVGTNKFTYSTAGDLATEDGPWASDTLTYTSTNFLRTALALAQPSASDWTQTYTYDNQRRLQSLASPAGTFSYQYQGSGASPLVKKLILGNATYVTNAFDGLSRLTNTMLKSLFENTLNQHGYGYDVGNRRTNDVRKMWGIGDSLSTVKHGYGYDAIGQVTTSTGFESDGTTIRLNEKLSYGYDAAGNLLQRTYNAFVRTFGVNAKNELTNATRSGTFTLAGFSLPSATNVTVNGTAATRYADGSFALDSLTLTNGTNAYVIIAREQYGRNSTNSLTLNLPATVSFQYDANGSLTNDGRRSFEYDDDNQLTAVVVAGVSRSEFAYDGLARRRVRKEYSWTGGAWSQTNEVRYVYDGMQVVQERNSNNVPQVSYTRGLSLGGGIGGLLAKTTVPTSSTSRQFYFHSDAVGNVTALTDEAERVVATYSYDPYGNVVTMAGTEAANNLCRFSSKEFHPQSGLYAYGFRFYDPNLQRWVNQDPMQEAGGLNLHQFSSNGPLNFVDPLGLTDAADDEINRLIPNRMKVPSANRLVSPIAAHQAAETTKEVIKEVPKGFFETGTWFIGGVEADVAKEAIAIGKAKKATAAGAKMLEGGAVNITKCEEAAAAAAKGGSKFKKKIPGLSGKAGATDIPSWAAGSRPLVGENGKDFAKRILDAKYGPSGYKTGSGSEFSKLQKYADRSFE